MEKIIESLNPAQREAVVNFEGPALIIAGAGSGKTRVLTSRIAYMVTHGVTPWNILALTFTNKAAGEMLERIKDLMPPMSQKQADRLWMGTFHSIFLRILRAESEKLGYPQSFTVYDTADSQSLIRSIIKELGLGDNEKYKPRTVFSKISRLKNDLITPVRYEEEPSYAAEDRKRGGGWFLEIYKRYVAQCKANGAMDFDDLLLNMVVLFNNYPEALAKYREHFRYILVDEYQDTNHVQYLIVKALAAGHGNVCVVGDDSQSIYSFRGAKIENILNFKRDFPAARIYKLEQNYRSTQTIVGAANSVIAHNRQGRELKKECFSAGEQGEKIKLLRAYTDREEAELVAAEIRALGRGSGSQNRRELFSAMETASQTEPVSWSEIAVLYRVNALSRAIEESLIRREIPYRIYRGHSFFDRKEIKDLLAYFRLIVNPRDDEAFRRIINYPARGIGNVTLERIIGRAKESGVSFWEAAAGLEDRKIISFVELINSLSLNRINVSLYDFGREVAVRSGIIGGYKADGSPESQSAVENIEELLNSMADFEAQQAENAALAGEIGGEDVVTQDADISSVVPEATLEEWLQSVALMTDMDEQDKEDGNKVTLMTVHAAKGLEFRYVFIVGLEEELFPSSRDGSHEEIEEERRLFYVALTRAKERTCLSLAGTRFINGTMAFRRPSRFIGEIDETYLDDPAESPRPAHGGGAFNSTARGGGGGFAIRGGEPDSRRNFGTAAQRNFGRPSGAQQPERVQPAMPDARFRKVSAATTGMRSGGSAYSQGAAIEQVGRSASVSELTVGARVGHAKFGPGTIEAVEPATAGDMKVVVVFDNAAAGRKTLLSKFANLQVF